MNVPCQLEGGWKGLWSRLPHLQQHFHGVDMPMSCCTLHWRHVAVQEHGLLGIGELQFGMWRDLHAWPLRPARCAGGIETQALQCHPVRRMDTFNSVCIGQDAEKAQTCKRHSASLQACCNVVTSTTQEAGCAGCCQDRLSLVAAVMPLAAASATCQGACLCYLMP